MDRGIVEGRRAAALYTMAGNSLTGVDFVRTRLDLLRSNQHVCLHFETRSKGLTETPALKSASSRESRCIGHIGG